MVDFFGCLPPQVPTMMNLTLLKHPGRVLPIDKLKSLAKKYFSIPVKYRPFYPAVLPKEAKKLARERELKVKKRKKVSSVAGERKVKRKVGRPKLIPPVVTGIQSIASFFRRL